jgi:hypothetical protein
MGKNIPETKLDQWALRCCGGIGTTLNLVMTASLLPIIAAKPVPFVPSSKLPSSAVQKASQRGAAIGRGPIRLRVENAMDELKTAAAAASRGPKARGSRAVTRPW